MKTLLTILLLTVSFGIQSSYAQLFGIQNLYAQHQSTSDLYVESIETVDLYKPDYSRFYEIKKSDLDDYRGWEYECLRDAQSWVVRNCGEADYLRDRYERERNDKPATDYYEESNLTPTTNDVHRVESVNIYIKIMMPPADFLRDYGHQNSLFGNLNFEEY